MSTEARNTLYKLHTPVPVPLRFHRDGYYRLAAKAECAVCGKGFMQIIRCHRISHDLLVLPVKRDDPNDEKVMSSFMLAACRNGVGNPRAHMPGCVVGRMPKGKFLLGDVKADRAGR